jgi:hypothetical protein
VAEDSDIVEPIEDAAETEEEEAMKAASNDAAMNLLPLVDKRSNVIKKAYDSALDSTLDDEAAFLKKFKPVVAKSKDAQLIAAFNGEARRVNGKTTTSNDASYSMFGVAAKKRPQKNDSKDPYSALEEAYAKRLKGEE